MRRTPNPALILHSSSSRIPASHKSSANQTESAPPTITHPFLLPTQTPARSRRYGKASSSLVRPSVQRTLGDRETTSRDRAKKHHKTPPPRSCPSRVVIRTQTPPCFALLFLSCLPRMEKNEGWGFDRKCLYLGGWVAVIVECRSSV